MRILYDSIGKRAILFTVAVLLVTVVSQATYSFVSLYSMAERNAEEYEVYVLTSTKEGLRNNTSLPYKILETYAAGARNTEILRGVFDVVLSQVKAILEDDSLSPVEKRSAIVDTVSKVRFDNGQNYVWLNSRDTMIWHPVEKLVGTDIADKSIFVDKKTGDLFLDQAVKNCLASEDGMAEFEYMWFKPGNEDELEPKISLITYIPELDWFLAGGIYYSTLIKIQKQRAIQAIREMRLPDGNYFWINDTTSPVPHMIMHATKPALDGTLLDNPVFNCATAYQSDLDGEIIPTDGKANLFSKMVEAVLASTNGEGFVWYDWPKPREGGGVTEELYAKVSYVTLFEEWGWIIGNGAYIDHIEGIVDRTRDDYDRAVTAIIRDSTIFGSLFMALVVLLLYRFFRRTVSIPLKRAMRFTVDLAQGDLASRMGGRLPCELGELGLALDSMAQALEKKAELAQRIAGGDLSSHVELASDRDMLGKALADMSASLKNYIDQVRVASAEVEHGASSIRESSRNLADGATEQAASLEEVTSTMSQLEAKTRKNAENAAQADALSGQVKETADRGAREMDRMVGAMEEINESSQAISRIIKVIDEIAFQTNLLALNAAVEAARAGRHGKGFAVVAEEVRNLAGRSAKAARETAELIQGSIGNVENGNAIAAQTSESLKQIVQGVADVARLLDEISTASNEQALGITHINQGLVQVEQVTHRTTSGVESVAGETETLAEQASHLKDLLTRFRIGK